jgi:SAM-dependent methyltransferase
MSAFVEIEGFRCYAPDVALSYDDYPSDGFDVTAEVEARSFWCRTRNRVLHQVFDRFVDCSQPIEMLEIGCGIGGVLRELRRIPNLRLTGSEVYLQGLRYARANLSDLTFIQLDATDMPFRNDFDVVGAFDVLEHIDADEYVMKGVYDALRPGGTFIVTVPQYPWMWSTLDEIVQHKRRYRRRDLVDKLTRAGFAVPYVTSFVTALFPFMMASRVMSQLKAKPRDAKAAFTAEVSLPGPINWTFDKVMRLDEAALRLGATLPFGGSLLAVARRK